MDWKAWTTLGLETLAVIVLVVMLVGQVVGQPLLFGFVTSSSMEPTIEEGAGFLAVPAPLVGPVGEGDIVVYRAATFDGGELTTHRIVDRTAHGFVTKGDANPFTDQDSGEPPVKREQIVAVAPQVNGHALTVPAVGSLVSAGQAAARSSSSWVAGLFGIDRRLGLQALAAFLFIVTVLAYVFGGDSDWNRDRSRDRETGLDVRAAIVMMGVAIVLAATAVMVIPSGPVGFDVVSVASESPEPGAVEAGGTENGTITFGNGGQVPIAVVLDARSDNVDLHRPGLLLPPGTTRNATVSLTAPADPGTYRHTVAQYRYLAVLPQPVLRGLYTVHPLAPVVVIDVLLGLVFVGVGIRLVGTGRIRSRPKTRIGLVTRLRSRL